MTCEIPSESEIPYVRFPEDPKIITVGDFKVFEYVNPSEMAKYVKILSDKVKLDNFDAVLVNMKGGMFLFESLSRLQGYSKNPVKIEYHRPENAYGATIVTPVPPELRNLKLLTVDDIYDSGGVFRAIMADSGPSSEAVAFVTKTGIPNQIQIPNMTIGLKIDDKWVGGCGMDLGVPDEENTFRNYPGLVVKI
ncbi:MAG: hypothetical protein HYV90_03330 [Candidatus Woesebacteria bacterium]|nr:MAG: hypothetical protein HYV90_03330 [Candidatus Woesebacteria bacterium]